MSGTSGWHGLWTSGMYGQFVEELIAASFSDFAPYAGADVQRVSVTRQISDEAQALLQFEENGDFSVSGTHRQIGTMGFSTSDALAASSQRADVALCVPLITSRTGSLTVAPSPQVAVPIPSDQSVRFADHTRGAQLVRGLQRVLGLGYGASPYVCLGQLEMSGSLLPTVWTSSRQAYGLRAGPVAARLTVLPYPPQLRAPELDRSESSGGETYSQSALARSKRPSYHYTLEAAACVPVPWLSGGHEGTVTDGGAAPQPAPWACTVACQHPLLMGDSLVGVALESDRIARTARVSGVPSTADPQDATKPRRVRFPASHKAGDSLAAITYTDAETSFRALLVQTVASKSLQVSETAVTGTNTSTLGADGMYYSVVGHNTSWTSLPTLLGLSASFYRGLCRASVAGIFHEGAADIEAAVVVDATPQMPKTPTLVKVGWNNLGRLAVGITSLFYDSLAVTLGVHAAPGEGVRFGVDIAF